MLFNSSTFLCIFLPITYFVFWCLRTKNQRYIWLTATGYAFYGAWNYKFCALMAFSTVVSYLAGLGLLRSKNQLQRRLLLVVPVAADLLLLGFFKYANFFLGTLSGVAKLFGGNVEVPKLDIILPIGISFYTFIRLPISLIVIEVSYDLRAIYLSSPVTFRFSHSSWLDPSSDFVRSRRI